MNSTELLPCLDWLRAALSRSAYVTYTYIENKQPIYPLIKFQNDFNYSSCTNDLKKEETSIARDCILVIHGSPVHNSMFISLGSFRMRRKNFKITVCHSFLDRVQSRVIRTCRQKLLEYVEFSWIFPSSHLCKCRICCWKQLKTF